MTMMIMILTMINYYFFNINLVITSVVDIVTIVIIVIVAIIVIIVIIVVIVGTVIVPP